VCDFKVRKAAFKHHSSVRNSSKGGFLLAHRCSTLLEPAGFFAGRALVPARRKPRGTCPPLSGVGSSHKPPGTQAPAISTPETGVLGQTPHVTRRSAASSGPEGHGGKFSPRTTSPLYHLG